MAAPQAAKKRILVVDDCFATRDLLTLVLTVEGYEVIGARDGREALGHLRSDTPPALVLLDLMMPIISGYQLLGLMKEDDRLAAIPVIILSAMGDSEPTPLPLAVAARITKPISEDSLIDRVVNTVNATLARSLVSSGDSGQP